MKKKSVKDIEMVANNLLVDIVLPSTTTDSGIEISEKDALEMNAVVYATVLHKGPLVEDFNIGDEIMIPPHGGTPVAIGKKVYHVFRETSLFGKFK